MAAATSTSTSTSTSTQLAEQMLNRAAPHYSFSFTPFLQRTYNHSLPADRPICKSYAATQHCPLGTRCPERHVWSGNSRTQDDGGSNPTRPGGFNSLVCKHWLRGLCKKGESCEFLHEYNLRRMPECNFFLRNGFCSNGDECLYLHVDPQSRLPPCPHYEQRGFCPLGPRCAKKHVRRALCPYYLAGFCPDGKQCKQGAHPHWKTEKELGEPTAKVDLPPQPAGEEGGGGGEREEDHWEGGRGDRDRDRDGEFRAGGHDRQGGYKDKFGSGRGGRWRGGGGGGGGRGGGGQRFRGRNH